LWKPAVGSKQLAIGNWRHLAICNWQLAKTKTNPKTTKDTKEHGGEQTTVEHSEVVSKKFRKKFRSPDF
jgi:hypothetical protein